MIPADKIQNNQYTRGNEYILNGKYYQGYYCIVLGNQYYTGKTYTNRSIRLTKAEVNVEPAKPTSLPPQPSLIRYFIKQVNRQPIVIKEVNEDTFNKFKNNPLYQTIEVKNINPLPIEAELQMPGLKAFLEG